MNKQKKSILVCLIFINILLVIGLIAFLLPKKSTSVSLPDLAKAVATRCANATYRPTCYEEEIPKLMKTISMEDAFKVTSLVQDIDKSYQYCHVLGHKLSAAEVDKDPSKWKEVLSRCPSGVCSNGCIHGGFQERFRKEHFTDAELKQYMPDLMSICEESKTFHPTGLEQASCYHALGHLTMYITNGEIRKSLPLCDKISKKSDGRDFTQLCYDGAFMQIYQPLEPDDFALVRGKQPTLTTVKDFCQSFTGAPQASCVSESWPLYRDRLMKDSNEIITICSQSPTASQGRCYMGLFYVMTAQLNFDLQKIIPYCGKLTDPIRGECFANAASRLIETDYRNIDNSVKLCNESAKYGDSDAGECFKELNFYAQYNFHKGSVEQEKLCSSIPDTYRNNCGSSTSHDEVRPFIHENSS